MATQSQVDLEVLKGSQAASQSVVNTVNSGEGEFQKAQLNRLFPNKEVGAKQALTPHSDGDGTRQLEDGSYVSKYDPEYSTPSEQNRLTAAYSTTNSEAVENTAVEGVARPLGKSVAGLFQAPEAIGEVLKGSANAEANIASLPREEQIAFYRDKQRASNEAAGFKVPNLSLEGEESTGISPEQEAFIQKKVDRTSSPVTQATVGALGIAGEVGSLVSKPLTVVGNVIAGATDLVLPEKQEKYVAKDAVAEEKYAANVKSFADANPDATPAQKMAIEAAATLDMLAENPHKIAELSASAISSVIGGAGAAKMFSASSKKLAMEAASSSPKVVVETIRKDLGLEAGDLTEEAMAKVSTEFKVRSQKIMDDVYSSRQEKVASLYAGVAESGNQLPAYQEKVDAMSDEELTAQSKDYAELRELGMTEQDAKSYIGSKGGLISAVLTFGLSVGVAKATGGAKATADVAESGVKSLKGAAKDIGRETLEETIQNPASQVSENIADVASGFDENKSLTEGVGRSAVEGFAGGLGGTTALKAGGQAAKATGKVLGTTASVAGKGLKAAGKATVDKVNSKVTNDTGVDSEKVSVMDSVIKEFQANKEVSDVAEGILKGNVEVSDLPSDVKETAVDIKTKRDTLAARIEGMRGIIKQAEESGDTARADSFRGTLKNNEEKLAKLDAKTGNVASISTSNEGFAKSIESSTAETIDDDISYQMQFEDENAPLTDATLSTVLVKAKELGASAKTIANLEGEIQLRKAAVDVSKDVRQGTPEWRGALSYMRSINNSIRGGSESSAKFHQSELQRFATQMQTKYEDFAAAQAEVISSGNVGTDTPIDKTGAVSPDGVQQRYLQTSKADSYVNGTESSDKLIAAIKLDSDFLNFAVQQSERVMRDAGIELNSTKSDDAVISAADFDTIQEAEPTTEEVTNEKSNQETEVTQEATSQETESTEESADVSTNAQVNKAAKKLTTNPQVAELLDNHLDALKSYEDIEGYTAEETTEAREALQYAEYNQEGKVKVATQIESVTPSYVNDHIPNPNLKEGSKSVALNEADIAHLTRNEFKEEAKLDSVISNQVSNTYDFEAKREIILERIARTVEDPEQLEGVSQMLITADTTIRGSIQQAVAKLMDGVNQPRAQAIYTKSNTNHVSNMVNAESGMLIPALEDSATLATMDEVADLYDMQLHPTDTAIRSFAGLSGSQEVEEPLRKFLATIDMGLSKDLMIETLGEAIARTAGLTFNGNDISTEARHKEALGTIAFRALVDGGIVKGTKINAYELAIAAGTETEGLSTYNPETQKTSYVYYTSYSVNPSVEVNGRTLGEVLTSPEVMSGQFAYADAIGSDRANSAPSIGAPRTNSNSIRRNKTYTLTKEQVATQDKASSMPLYLNKSVVGLLEQVSPDVVAVIGGLKVAESLDTAPEERTQTKRTIEDIENKNKGITRDVESLTEFVRQIKRVGEVGVVPFFHTFFTTIYQRQHVDSNSFNYQSSKSIHRFLTHTGDVVINMKDTSLKTLNLLGIAQGLDIGIDKQSAATSIDQLNELAQNSELKEMIDYATQYAADGIVDADMVNKIAKYSATKANMHTFVAILEYGKHIHAENTGTPFTSNISIEIDGVNNGPITSILLNIVSLDLLEDYLSKGGIRLSGDGVSSAENSEALTKSGKTKEKGLYEEMAVLLTEEISRSLTEGEQGPTATQLSLRSQLNLKAWSRLVKAGNNGSAIVARNDTKGFITKLFYGSGRKALIEDDVSNGTYGSMVDAIYSRLQAAFVMEDAVTRSKDVATTMRVLSKAMVRGQYTNKDGVVKPITVAQFNKEAERNYTMLIGRVQGGTKYGIDNFVMTTEIIKALRDATSDGGYGDIKYSVGSMKYANNITTTDLINNMANDLAVVYELAVEGERELRHKELGLSRFQDVSKEVMQEIRAKFSHLLPKLVLNTHKGKSADKTKEVGIPVHKEGRVTVGMRKTKKFNHINDNNTAYRGSLRSTDTPVFGTSHVLPVGVGGQAASTISVADASPLFSVMQNMNKAAMYVFDGLLQGVGGIHELSAVANKGWYDSYTENNPLEQLTTIYEKAINEIPALRDGLDPVTQELFPSLTEMNDALYVAKAHVSSINGIKNKVKTAKVTVDQFGGMNGETINIENGKVSSESPISKILVENSDYEVTRMVGELMQESLNNTAQENQLKSKFPRWSNNTKLAGTLGRNWSEPRLMKSPKTSLLSLVKALDMEETSYRDFITKGLIPNILAPAFAVKGLPAIKVVTTAEMNKALGNKRVAVGAYDHSTNTVYLNSSKSGVNLETLMHELIHAAVDTAITNADQETLGGLYHLSVEAQKAMMDKVEGEPTDKDKYIPWIADNGKFLPKEFLAWSLSNFHIMTTLAEKEASTETKNFFSKYIKFVRDVFTRIISKVLRSDIAATTESLLSYTFATAQRMAQAENINTSKVSDEVSYQSTLEEVQMKSPETVLEELSRLSKHSSEHLNHLQKVMQEVVQPVVNEVPHVFKDSMNLTNERMAELRNEGINTNPDTMMNSFGLDGAETYVYEVTQKALAQQLPVHGVSSRTLTKVYRQLKEVIKPSDFLLDGETELMPEAIKAATAKYNSLFGSAKGTQKAIQVEAGGGLKTVEYHSDYLANFGAMALASQEVRTVLDKVKLRAKPETKLSLNKLDVFIKERVIQFTNSLIERKSKIYGSTPSQAINTLAKNIAVADQRAKGILETLARRAASTVGPAYFLFHAMADKAIQTVTESGYVQGLKNVSLDMIKDAPKWFQGNAWDKLYYQVHHGYLQFIPRFIESDIKGTTASNARIKRLSVIKNKAVAGARDGLSKATGVNLNRMFPRLDKRTEIAFTDVLLDSDFHALMANTKLSNADLIAMLEKPEVLESYAKFYEEKVRRASTNYGTFHVKAAKSLGSFMTDRVATESLTPPNAELIAAYRQAGMVKDFDAGISTKNIDILASLEALKLQNQGSKDLVAQMLKTNPDSMAEMSKLMTVWKDKVIAHQYSGDSTKVLKGMGSDLHDSFKDVKFVSKDELIEHTSADYVLHEKLAKSTWDSNPEEMYIVHSKTGGLAEFQQGIISTADSTRAGVRNLDGRTRNDGFSTYAQKLAYSQGTNIRVQSAANIEMFSDAPSSKNKGRIPVPVYGDNGFILGYEYMLTRKETEALLGRDKSFKRVLSHAMGRTVETTHTNKFNEKVNQALYDTYQEDKNNGTLHDYIEVSEDAPTEEGREAFRLMPPAARAHAETIWGKQPIRVKNGLFEMTFGYRKPSLANVFRKNANQPEWLSYLAQGVTANYRYSGKVITGIKYAEKGLKEISGFIKDAIVVKGVAVTVGNLASNTVQLVLQNDMSLVEAVKLQIEGLTRGREYQISLSKLRSLELQLQGIDIGTAEYAKLDNTIAEIKSDIANNPAKELIDQGYLSAIVEDIESDDNPFSFANRISSHVTGATKNVPDSVKWLGNSLTASKDSEVYKTLYMFTQLGDFGARYAMYKNIENKQKRKPNKTELDSIVDAFVNYDLPSNKYLQYLGDVGQLWFFKYYARIQLQIIKGTIKNPKKALAFFALSHVLPVDIYSYYDASFLGNPIANKFGMGSYVDMGLESLPVHHLASTVF